MAWPDLAITDLYTEIITKINAGLGVTGKLFKNQSAGDYVDQIRVNSTLKRLETWNGSAWIALDLAGTGIAAESIATGTVTANLIGSVNELTGTKQAVGFTLAGGTTSKTLTVSGDATVAGTNSGNETTGSVGALIIGATAKTTVVDADYLPLMDSEASNLMKKLSWSYLKSVLKIYFDTQYMSAAASAVFTGTVWDYAGTTAPSGWLMLSGQTIGDAASGGSARANADTESLFTLLWNGMGNGEATVSSGRGGSAATDFAAHKTITLPDARGRVIAGKDNMGGTTASRLTSASGIAGTTLGVAGGGQTHTLSEAELASHAHTQQTGGLLGGVENMKYATDPASGGGLSISVNGFGDRTAVAAVVTVAAGSGTAHANVQPTLVLNKIIKL